MVTNVNELAKAIKVSPQTLYSIIKRNNMKVDFDVLLKICDYLNVDVELFYRNKNINKKTLNMALTPHEQKIIEVYRTKPPDAKKIIDAALGIESEQFSFEDEMKKIEESGVIETMTCQRKTKS